MFVKETHDSKDEIYITWHNSFLYSSLCGIKRICNSIFFFTDFSFTSSSNLKEEIQRQVQVNINSVGINIANF